MSNDSNVSAWKRPAMPLLRRIPTKYALWALGIVLAADIIFYLVAVEPLGRRDAEKRGLLSALSGQVETKKKDVEQLQLVVSKVEQARSGGDGLLQGITLPRRTANSTLYSELINAASQAGIDTREGNFEIEPIEGTEEYGMISVSANFRGEYQNLVRFLNQIDRSERFLIIDSLAATPRTDSEQLQFTMRFNTLLREI